MLSDHQSFIIVIVEKWAQSIVSFNLYSWYANFFFCLAVLMGFFTCLTLFEPWYIQPLWHYETYCFNIKYTTNTISFCTFISVYCNKIVILL